MAYTSGTAINYKDLLAIMVTFAAGNGWVILEQTESKVYLKGTGLEGLDEIYCGVETYEDPANNRFNWSLAGSWGYRVGRSINAQPVGSNIAGTDSVIAYLWNNAIPYWITCNPRRIILFAKVGTTYQSVHLGLITPAGTDAQYPYPLLIGGAHNTLAKNYSDAITNYWAISSYENARMSVPGGQWGSFNTGSNLQYNPTLTVDGPALKQIPVMFTALDGTYYLDPIFIRGGQSIFVLGVIDGLFRVTGYNNAAESVVTVDGVNYMVFPGGSRSSFGDYCAMRLN